MACACERCSPSWNEGEVVLALNPLMENTLQTTKVVIPPAVRMGKTTVASAARIQCTRWPSFSMRVALMIHQMGATSHR